MRDSLRRGDCYSLTFNPLGFSAQALYPDLSYKLIRIQFLNALPAFCRWTLLSCTDPDPLPHVKSYSKSSVR